MNRFSALAVLALSAATAQAAPPATLSLDPSPTRTLAPLALGGFNYGNWMNVLEFREQFARVKPTSLRFPAGNAGDENDLNDAALAVLRVQAGVLGSPPLIVQTRVFGGKPGAQNTPEAAAAAAREARRLGLKVAYWNIGNEPDLYATNRLDPSWTPEKYCATFRAFRQAILAVDPAARFAGPSISNKVPFLEGFVRECGDVVDLLTWHYYPSQGELSDREALATAADATAQVERYRALLASPRANPKGYRRTVGLGVTEFGLSYLTGRPHHLVDQVAALWAAEVALRYAEAGAEVAEYFALQGTGGHGLLDLAGVPRPSYYAFRQLAGFRGASLTVAASDPSLWAHAAKDGNRLTVLVTNTNTADSSLVPGLPGWAAVGAKTFTEKTAGDEADFSPLPLSPLVPLPARSLTRIVYRQLAQGETP